MRVGLGFDAQRFDRGGTLVLGGIAVDGPPALTGRSDGDAVAHALIDGLLGAAGLGSLEGRFPDDDPELAGADSLDLLASAVRDLEAENYQVVNADVTVVAAPPPVASRTRDMEEELAERLHVGPGHVSVKTRSGDGPGWMDAGEGIAVMAVILVDRVDDSDLLHASLRSGG